MKMHTTRRLLAFALAMLMMLPLISVPAFAKEPTVYFSEDFESRSTVSSSWLSSYPSTASIQTGGGNKTLSFELDGSHASTTTYPTSYTFYVYETSGKKVYPVTTDAAADATSVSGTFVYSSTTYTLDNVTVNDNTQLAFGGKKFILITRDQIDGYIGYVNVAKAIKMKNSAIAYDASADKIVFEMKYYFSTDAKVDRLSGRITPTSGNNVELISLSADGKGSVTVKPHENATATAGSNKIVPAGKWFTVSIVLDTTTGDRDVYVDHVYAFTATNGSKLSLTTPLSFAADKWQLIQINRGMGNLNNLEGSVMIDDVKIYDGMSYVGQPAPEPGSDDFEAYNVGTKITPAYGFNAAHTAEIFGFNKVLADSDGNKFVRVPTLWDGVTASNGDYNGGVSNYDRTLMPNHNAITLSDDYLVMDMSYRLHGSVTSAAETVELQLRDYNLDLTGGVSTRTPRGGTVSTLTEDETQIKGRYLQLLRINMQTGEIDHQYATLTLTGAAGLLQDTWNQVRLVFDLKNVEANIYVNGVLYGTYKDVTVTDTNWAACTSASNITVPANKIIVAKMNKVKNAFAQDTTANEDYSNVNYLDIDNINITSKTVAEMDSEFNPTLYAGLLSTENKTQVRLNAPAGLRFATKIDIEKLDALQALADGGYIRDLEFGTLIVPEDYLGESVSLTFDSLEAAGKNYLAIAATYGKYYSGGIDSDPNTTHFVGSIVKIKDANLARDFAATGYVKVTLFSGAVYCYYSDTMCVANIQTKATQVRENTDMSGWANSSKRIIEAYSKAQSFEAMYAEDLQGLNVLALGDSLFSGNDTTLGIDGDIDYDRSSQWVNQMGQKYGWTLTNLGIGGMTVSYQEDVNYLTDGKKASMYHWLMEDINEYHWNVQDESLLFSESNKYQYYTNSEGTRCTYNTYFQIGDFTGKTNEDVDLIILEGGCNDYGKEIAAPLGTVGSTDGSTFIGAYNAITQKLAQMYPNAKIVFITTWYLGNQSRPDGCSSIEYSTSVNRLYEQYYAEDARYHLIDAGDPAVSGVNMRDAAFKAEYCIKPTDGYHLNNKGMAIMVGNMTPNFWEFWVNRKTHN